MSVNPYPFLPRDNGGQPMQQFPAPRLAVEEYSSENATVSSVITVTKDTTTLEIAAVNGPAVMRWVATSDTQASIISAAGATANMDHVIPKDTVRQFAIPIEVGYFAPSSMVGANTLNGLYQRVAVKSIGVASIIITEY